MANINLNILNYLGSTSLHSAINNGHLSVMQLLLDRGANIDLRDRYGEFISFIYGNSYHNLPFH